MQTQLAQRVPHRPWASRLAEESLPVRFLEPTLVRPPSPARWGPAGVGPKAVEGRAFPCGLCYWARTQYSYRQRPDPRGGGPSCWESQWRPCGGFAGARSRWSGSESQLLLPLMIGSFVFRPATVSVPSLSMSVLNLGRYAQSDVTRTRSFSGRRPLWVHPQDCRP